MLRYKWHKKARFGQDDEELSSCPERVTWLTFDQWLTFYNADPDHWEHMLNSNWDDSRYYYLPVYRKNIYNSNQYRKWKYIYIKFLTRKDYRKYLKYKKELEKRGEDYENTQEVLALAKTVREEGAKRVEQLQKEQDAMIEELRRCAGRASNK